MKEEAVSKGVVFLMFENLRGFVSKTEQVFSLRRKDREKKGVKVRKERSFPRRCVFLKSTCPIRGRSELASESWGASSPQGGGEKS